LTAEAWLSWLLVGQAVVGGYDTLYNHEIVERLPHRPEAHAEIGLHATREAIYASLFGGLAWLAFEGLAVWIVVALLVGEVLVTTCDEFVENRIRVLPQNERVTHVFLTLNLGVLIALLASLLVDWSARPTGFSARPQGLASWLLSAFAAASIVWSMRDLAAWRRLRRAARQG
jgi:hypothetical protein